MFILTSYYFMKSNFSLCILLVVMLSSCKKTSNIDVTVSTSGKLTYRFLDDAGKGIPNVNVSLFDIVQIYSGSAILLDTRKTDGNGSVDFGDLNPSTYKIVPDSPMVNNVKYVIEDYIQVLTGKTGQRDIKVSDYSGTFNVLVEDYSTGLGLNNIGVLLVPADEYGNIGDPASYFTRADAKGITDSKGIFSSKVPSDKSYVIATYNLKTNTIYNTAYGISLKKGETTTVRMFVYTP